MSSGASPYLGKVTKAFLLTQNGYEMAANSDRGEVLPPQHMRDNGHIHACFDACAIRFDDSF